MMREECIQSMIYKCVRMSRYQTFNSACITKWNIKMDYPKMFTEPSSFNAKGWCFCQGTEKNNPFFPP